MAHGETAALTSSRPMPPRTPYEEAIVGIWRDVLGRSDIGVFDDFFDLDAHSLHAIQVVARIRKTLGVDIPVRDFFEAPTVAALASAVAAGASSERRVVPLRSADAEPVLSFDQQRLWLENQLLPPAAYNVHGRRRLVGPLDVATLQASVRAVLTRHEALRTRFPTAEGRPVQVVDELDEGWRIRFEDVSDAPGDRFDAARRLADEEAATPFDLAVGPLFRCLLIRLSDADHVLCVTMHHIISDAWSIGVFVRELSTLYEAGGDVARADLPALPVQYRDYAVWQRTRLEGEALQHLLDYWRGHVAGAPAALALPTAQRTLSQGAGAGRVRFALSAPETAALRDLCRKHGVTTFMALLASLATVLGRWSGQSDVVIGVPVASRNDTGTDQLIGFFVNTLPLRVDLSGDPSFAELLGQVRRVALDGYAHADLPLDVLVKELQVARDPRRTPLFQVILNVIGSPEVERISGVSVEPIDTPVLPSKFDIQITAQESDGTLQVGLDFNADRYQPAMLRILAGHWETLLRAVLEDPTLGILGYPFQATPEEIPAEPPRPATAPHLAVQRHAQRPDRVAVVDGDGEWSYRWLSEAADRVALALARRESPDPERFGVVRRPTAGFVATVLGCAKAGATFSVIEPAGPVPARYLGVSTVLDVRPTDEAGEDTVDLSEVIGGPAEPSRAAQEAGFSRGDGDWAAERFSLGPDDRFAVLGGAPGLLLSALSSAFHAGATLLIPDPSVTGDAAALTAWLRDNSITVGYLSPPVLRAVASGAPQPELPALRYAFVANSGDLISHDVAALRTMSPACRCVALYRIGPDGRPLAVHPVPDDWQLETAPLRVPLGTVLAEPAARLLHPSGAPAATGEVAELRLGSYQTGDLARRWPDGTLEYVGQLGGGATVETVETVAALRDLPAIRDALVTEHPGADGSTRLVGYVTGADPDLVTAGIRQHLVTRLPEHLVPEQLVVLDSLPLTPDGEYDLGALPDPTVDGDPGDGYVAPRTPMERQLAEILQELLGVERVGIHDSFFELGGFSLLATQLTTRIRETYDVELSLREVFESPTVDGLAQLIVRTQGELTSAEDLEALLDEIGQTG